MHFRWRSIIFTVFGFNKFMALDTSTPLDKFCWNTYLLRCSLTFIQEFLPPPPLLQFLSFPVKAIWKESWECLIFRQKHSTLSRLLDQYATFSFSRSYLKSAQHRNKCNEWGWKKGRVESKTFAAMFTRKLFRPLSKRNVWIIAFLWAPLSGTHS